VQSQGKLGIRFLQIDSLCIIQDSEDKDCDTLPNATLTIVTSGPKDSSEGFLKLGDLPHVDLKVPCGASEHHPGITFLRDFGKLSCINE
jgi:hypothetical protein